MLIVFSNDAMTRKFKNAKFDRGTLDNVWQIGKSKPTIENHSAGYPKQLTDKILLNFADQGFRVFDPFLGTGTTAISSHFYGCDFVGCELDEDYYKAAVNRFNQETKQIDMF